MAVVLLQQANKHEMHIVQLLSQAASLGAEERRRKGDLLDISSDEKEGPCRKNTQDGGAEATYSRRGPFSLYEIIRE